MIPILYLDDDVVVVDKPEGVPSVPAGEDGGVAARLRDEVPGRLYPVHRLDKDASGVLAFARTAAAHRHLSLEFERRTVRKAYAALVHGRVADDRGRVEEPIRVFGSGRVGVDPERGLPSRTDFEVEARFAGATLLRVRPLTGRRHQIRVHLYCLGHPIVGDRLYGDPALRGTYPRLMLHAAALEVKLPSGRTARFEAPPPESFRAVVASFPG